MITVIDDVIDKGLQERLEAVSLSVEFPWHYHSTSVYRPGEVDISTIPYTPGAVDTPFFSHLLFDLQTVRSHFIRIFLPIMEAIPNIRSMELAKFKLNLTMPSTVTTPHTHTYPHVDLGDAPFPFITAIYYFNDSDGDTVIFNNDDMAIKQRVQPKRGRMVIFDGHTLHAGNNPSRDAARVVANINLIHKPTNDQSI